MPRQTRYTTDYPGVYYLEGKALSSNKTERIYYIVYRRKNEKQVEEKAGRASQGMTPAKASRIRSSRMEGKDNSNTEKREEERKRKEEEAGKWTIQRIWEDYRADKPDNNTWKTDGNRFKNHLAPLFADKDPHEILALDTKRLKHKLEKKGLTPQTIKHVLTLLKRIVNHGIKYNYCAPLPFKIEMPRVDNIKTEDLTQEQMRRLWDAIEVEENLQAKHFVKFILFTGMRRGELFKLQWTDINFERGFILIRDPKGGKAQEIPLNESARSMLLSHDRPYADSPFVFPGRNGEQRVEIKNPIDRIRKRAGLPKDFRPLHGLRHVYASMLASSGKVDMYTLQKLLTHKSPQMTQRYAHLRDETLKRASSLAGELIADSVGSGQKQDLEQSRKVVNLKARNQ